MYSVFMTPPSFPAARISPNRYHRFVTNRTAVKTVVSLRCQNFCRPRLGAATIRARGWAAPRGETASVSLLTNSHGVRQVRIRYPPKRTASSGLVSLVRGFMTSRSPFPSYIWTKSFIYLFFCAYETSLPCPSVVFLEASGMMVGTKPVLLCTFIIEKPPVFL